MAAWLSPGSPHRHEISGPPCLRWPRDPRRFGRNSPRARHARCARHERAGLGICSHTCVSHRARRRDCPVSIPVPERRPSPCPGPLPSAAAGASPWRARRARDPDRKFGPASGASSPGQKRAGVFRKLVTRVWA